MGNRKWNVAERRKQAKKEATEVTVKLNHYPTSPRKMRYVADLIRGKSVDTALSILQFNRRAGAYPLWKLVLAGVNAWREHNPDAEFDEGDLVIKAIQVNEGKSLKRLMTAPQGRAYRIRKRSNHVVLTIDSALPLNAMRTIETIADDVENATSENTTNNENN
ncbi:MAG: 50S ribosomal protein L22 [Bacteroidia bacterium]|nr:50S ribosomal protein L22 [Bacteroidia bacterium]MDW8347403.1 50S ribosomal protein L22 [Bacteroidia bacterium]